MRPTFKPHAQRWMTRLRARATDGPLVNLDVLADLAARHDVALMARGAHWDNPGAVLSPLTYAEAYDGLAEIRAAARPLLRSTHTMTTAEDRERFRAASVLLVRLQLLEDIYLSWLAVLGWSGRTRHALTRALRALAVAASFVTAPLLRRHSGRWSLLAGERPPRLRPCGPVSSPREPGARRALSVA